MELGKIIKDLPPSEYNARNSEGDFLELDNGDILFVYSYYRKGNYDDNAPSDLALIVSKNRGETFSEPKIILKSEALNAVTLISITLLKMQNGDIGLFYLKSYKINKCIMFLQRSCDNGMTWTQETRCMPQDNYYCVANGRVIRLSNGDLLIPASVNGASREQRATDCSNSPVDISLFHVGHLQFFLSNDDGYSWQVSGGHYSLPAYYTCKEGLAEPCVIELGGGRLWCVARTDLLAQYELFSDDYGKSWTSPKPSFFTSSISPMMILREPTSSNLVAVWNPVPIFYGRHEVFDGIWVGARNPLSIAVSSDNGKTFSTRKNIELDETDKHGYCYPSAIFLDNFMLISYCAGGIEDKSCLNRLRIRKIPLQNILNLD